MTVNYKGHKIFAFSDTHGMYRKLEVPADADILICAGDACEGFNPADLQDFFSWYNAIPAKLRIFVPGNHDRIFYQEPTRARNLVPGGVMYLEDGGIELDGIKFYSVPVRPYLKALPDILRTLISLSPTARPGVIWTEGWETSTCSWLWGLPGLNTTSLATSTRRD